MQTMLHRFVLRAGTRKSQFRVCGQRLSFVEEYAIPATAGNIHDKSPKHDKRSQLIIWVLQFGTGFGMVRDMEGK